MPRWQRSNLVELELKSLLRTWLLSIACVVSTLCVSTAQESIPAPTYGSAVPYGSYGAGQIPVNSVPSTSVPSNSVPLPPAIPTAPSGPLSLAPSIAPTAQGYAATNSTKSAAAASQATSASETVGSGVVTEAISGIPPALTMNGSDQREWYMPWTWVPLDGWANSAELGINGSDGSAKSFSIQAGLRFKRKTDINLFDVRLTHNRTEANGIEKQNNALMYADYDRYFGESRWTGFVKNGLEYDRFKAFDLRYNINAGIGYSFIKRESLTLKGRFGSGTSREFGGPDDRWVPEALFGADYEHQLNKRNKWIAKVDYFPEWGNFTNYRIVSDVSWEMLWDEAGNLSFKVGAIDRYDSTPNGRKPNDLTYSILLLYKF